MGTLLAKLGLPPVPAGATAAGAPPLAPGADLGKRLDTLSASAAKAAAAGAKNADELKKRVGEATAAAGAAAAGDKAAVEKAHRALDVVQMAVDDAAKPVPKYVPSPESIRFTKHVKETLAGIAAIGASKAADALRLKKAAIDAAKLGQGSKARAAATEQLEDIDKQVGLLKGDADKAAKAAAAPKEQLFTMKVGAKQLTDVTRAQACAELAKVLADLERKLQTGFEAHCEELKIQREEPFAAWVSSGITAVKSKIKGEKAVDINDLNIWDAPRDLLYEARKALKQQDVETIPKLIPGIVEATRQASSKVKKHNTDSIESAETAVEIARKTQDVAVDVISKSAEKLGGKAAGVAAGAGARTLFKGAEEWSAVNIAKTKKKIDWGAVAKEGAAALVTELAGMLLHGFLADRFSGLFGAYLKKAAFSEKELLEMGKAVGLTVPLPRDYFMTKGQQLVKDFLLKKAEGLVKGVVEDLVKDKKESDPSTDLEDFVKKAAAKMASGKAIEMFVEFVVEQAGK